MVRLQCRFKSWSESRDIDCDYDIVLQLKTFAYVKDTQYFVMRSVFGDSLCSFLASRLTTVSLDNFIL